MAAKTDTSKEAIGMWAFFSSWFRRLLFFSVVVPLIGWVLGKAGDALETRRGPSTITRGLHKAREFSQERRGRRFR